MYRTVPAALDVMRATLGEPRLRLHTRESGPCADEGEHINVRDPQNRRAGSITTCPCCEERGGRPIETERCRIVW